SAVGRPVLPCVPCGSCRATASRSGDILHGQEDKPGHSHSTVEATGVEEHNLPPDMWEIVDNLKALKHAIVQQNVLQQFTESSAVPLAVAQFAEGAMFDAAGGLVEDLIERLIRRYHAQLCIEHHQRFPHGLDNALGVDTGFVGKQLSLLQLGHIHERDHQAVDHVLDSTIGPHPHEIPGACLRVYLPFLRDQGLEDLLRIVLQADVFQV